MSAIAGFLLAWQIAHNLQQLRSDMLDNARAHADRLNAGLPVADVRTDMVSCFQEYTRRIGWVENVLADTGRRTRLSDGLAPWPDAVVEVEQMAAAARAITTTIADMPRTTRAQLLDICATVRDGVTRADMLWND
jgi:hypothetical protein